MCLNFLAVTLSTEPTTSWWLTKKLQNPTSLRNSLRSHLHLTCWRKVCKKKIWDGNPNQIYQEKTVRQPKRFCAQDGRNWEAPTTICQGVCKRMTWGNRGKNPEQVYSMKMIMLAMVFHMHKVHQQTPNTQTISPEVCKKLTWRILGRIPVQII